MKPKIRYFCVACQRPKMLFDTQDEADRFIAYNRGDILRGRRKAPIRSYYCEICGGWHVTSNPSKEDAKRLDERDKALAEEVDKKVKANLKPQKKIEKRKFTITEVDNKFDLAERLMTKGTLDDAERHLTECKESLKYHRLFKKSVGDKLMKREYRLTKLSEKLKELKRLLKATKEEQNKYLSANDLDNEGHEIRLTLTSILTIKEIDWILKGIEKDVNNRNYAIAVRVLQCKRLFKSIYGAGKKEIVNQFKERLESAENRVKEVIYGS